MLDASDFIIEIFKSLDSGYFSCTGKKRKVYYCLLSLKNEDVEKHAEKIEYMLTLYFKSGSRKKFNRRDKHKFTPFASKDIQYIVYNLFDEMFNINLLKETSILEKVILLHNHSERDTVTTQSFSPFKIHMFK